MYDVAIFILLGQLDTWLSIKRHKYQNMHFPRCFRVVLKQSFSYDVDYAAESKPWPSSKASQGQWWTRLISTPTCTHTTSEVFNELLEHIHTEDEGCIYLYFIRVSHCSSTAIIKLSFLSDITVTKILFICSSVKYQFMRSFITIKEKVLFYLFWIINSVKKPKL